MKTLKKRIKWELEEPKPNLSFKNVHTICEESKCPNRWECSKAGIATFLIGGGICTRNCKFCHVKTGSPIPIDKITKTERDEIVAAVLKLNLNYVVITSVTRDDQEEELATHFASLIFALKTIHIKTETLIPDFHAKPEILSIIGNAKPDVLSHNIETTKRLHSQIRPQADYDRSLMVYDFFYQNYPEIKRKAGFMVGLGETYIEIEALLQDLKKSHIHQVTIGQYLRPSKSQVPVRKIYLEKDFDILESLCKKMNFSDYKVGPFVRTSYMASVSNQRIWA